MSETRDRPGDHAQTMGTEPVERISLREIADYELLDVIGRGGMGEIMLARDKRIGRDVALKRMRAGTPSPELVERFLREATIQARLDHPSIAPVHELGYDSEGLPYFTMKRVVGTTLAELLAKQTERADTDGEPLSSGTRVRPQRLLRALVDVCQAVELAHARLIVHRDLKPQNIMLGDYGEVYVLDWGVARVLASDRAKSQPATADEVAMPDGVTRAGELLGTPGFMAPEQVRGEAVAPAADIYSLGAILFEILAGEPLHPRGRDALTTTLDNVERSPAQRRPERAIAPELDAICAAALATDPAARPTAGALASTLQDYLDGDRDVARRKKVAAELSTKARQSLTAGDYEQAVRTAGRALAFDPSSTAAAEVVTSAIIHEPTELPRDLAQQLEAEEIRMMRARSRRAIAPYAGIFLIVPMLPFVTVLDWSMLAAVFATFTAMITLTWINVRVGLPIAVTLIGHTLSVLMFTRLTGPLIITPVLVCAILLSVTSIPPLARRPWAIAVWTVATTMLPFIVEWLGLFAPTWNMTFGGIRSHGSVFAVQSGFVLLGHCVAILLVAAYARRIGRDRSEAQRRLFVQAWRLSHLLPKAPAAK